MAFPKSLRTAWVALTAAPQGIKTQDLVPYQVGLFNEHYTSITTGTFQTNRNVRLAAGSGSKGQTQVKDALGNIANVGNVNVSYKSQPIFGHNIDKIWVSKPVKTAKNFIGYLGYDGLDTSKTLDFKPGRQYAVEVVIKGQPVRAIFGQERRESFEVDGGCLVTGQDENENVAPKLLDDLVARINRGYIVSRLMKAEKVVTPATNPTKISFTKYNLTLCDTGDSVALAQVQAQYPGTAITRITRKGSVSVYQMIRLTSAGTPTAFTQSDVVIPDCTTCPSGYTLVAGGKLFEVTIDNTNADLTASAQLTEVQTKFATAIRATKISFEDGTSKYLVVMPTTFVIPGTIPTETTIQDLNKTTQPYCTQNTPLTTAWVAGTTMYKVKRTLELTKKIENCDTNAATELASLVAAYPVKDDIASAPVIASENDCNVKFTIEQYSNLMEDGCDTEDLAKFNDIKSWNGFIWKPVVVVPGSYPTAVGIKFTGTFIDQRTQGCAFDPKDFVTYDPVTLEVSVYELTKQPTFSSDISLQACTDYKFNWTVVQYPTRQELLGQSVIRDVILSRNYNQELYVSPSQELGGKFSLAEGLEYGVDVNDFYYAVHVTHNADKRTNNTASEPNMREEVVIYFPESAYAEMIKFIAVLNTYVSSSGIYLDPVML